MNGAATEEYLVRSGPGHTVILLADHMGCGAGDCFAEGSEGLFLLRLAALLASGWGGRVLMLKVLIVPEGESISTYSTRAQSLRKSLENETLVALAGTKEHASGLVTPVVRVALHGGVAQEVRAFLETEPGALLLLPMEADTRQGKREPRTMADGQPSNNWLGTGAEEAAAVRHGAGADAQRGVQRGTRPPHRSRRA